MPEVSIIIVNYNTFEYTSNCIASVIDKTKDLNYEIILVDNCSHECDPQLFKDKFPQITLIKNDVNAGFAKGNNLGIAHSSGEYILLLNSDTELCNNAISLALETFKNKSNVGVMSAKLIYPSGEAQFVCRRFPSIRLTIFEFLRLHKLFSKEKRAQILQGGYFDHESYLETDAVWGAFFLFPRQVLECFPENKLSDTFFMYGEDMEWCYVIKKAGYHIVYDPQGVVLHHIAKSDFKKSGSGRDEVMLKNRFIFLKKYKGKFYTVMLYVVWMFVTMFSRHENKKGVLKNLYLALLN